MVDIDNYEEQLQVFFDDKFYVVCLYDVCATVVGNRSEHE